MVCIGWSLEIRALHPPSGRQMIFLPDGHMFGRQVARVDMLVSAAETLWWSEPMKRGSRLQIRKLLSTQAAWEGRAPKSQ